MSGEDEAREPTEDDAREPTEDDDDELAPVAAPPPPARAPRPGARALEVTVGPEAGRLDLVVTEAVRAEQPCSRSEVQGWIEAGRVDVRRGERLVPPKPGLKLRANDRLAIRVPAPPPPPEPIRAEAITLTILHQDEALLILDKPAGLTVHPGAGQRDGTLVSALLHASAGRLSSLGGAERPGIVHRLDKDTSGVIAVARTDVAHRALAAQFHDRTVKKVYLALVDGAPPDEGAIDLPIARHPRDRKRMLAVSPGREAGLVVRAARTLYRTLERFPGPRALVEVAPETGRTHQIRVHMKAISCPLVADATYGRSGALSASDLELPGERVLLERHALHAARLSLDHPTTGRRMTFEAPLPADLAAALVALRGAPRS